MVVEENEAAVASNEGATAPGAHPVGDGGTDVAAEGAGGGDQEKVEAAGVDQVAGEGHDDFGGEGDAGRLDRHEEGHARIAGGRDDGDDELGEGGEDSFAHASLSLSFRRPATGLARANDGRPGFRILC